MTTAAAELEYDVLETPEGAISAVCVECGARFTDSLTFDFDAERHKMLTGHTHFDYESAEPDGLVDADLMDTAERQALNAAMAEWFGM